MTRKAAVTASACVLAHVPSFVRYGSKPSRVIRQDGAFLASLESRLRGFDEAVAYPPHQVFIGNLGPQALRETPFPWYENPSSAAAPSGPFGRITSEEGFLVLLKRADACGLVQLFGEFARAQEAEELDDPSAFAASGENQAAALPLFHNDEVAGSFRGDHEEDESLTASVLLENLAAKATAYLALKQLLGQTDLSDEPPPDFLINCSEEAVGDRYQRGGGNLAKAVGEMAGLQHASGTDVKNFCAGPLNAMVLAGSLVAAGVFDRVAVVGGGSLPKLGMKAAAHIEKGMPVLEDVLAGFSAMVTADGEGPQIRLDHVGLHRIGTGHTQQAILESLVAEPLDRLGLKLSEVPLYATELHNPEITAPAGAGDVPRTNYQYIAALAALRGEIDRTEIPRFAEKHGLPGFAPSQGHIASAVPALPHALRGFRDDGLGRAFFLAKGSLFLGRMTRLSDGISFLLTDE